jgi:hypothetical protein
VQDLVYLYLPTLKPCLSKKNAKTWSGPLKFMNKIFDLNYEKADKKGKRQLVHVNRLNKASNLEVWKQNGNKEPERNAPKKVMRSRQYKRDPQADFAPYLLAYSQSPDVRSEQESQTDHSPAPRNSPIACRNSHFRQNRRRLTRPATPISRRELQTSRTQHPFTQLRAENQSNNNVNPEVRQ